MSIGKWIKKQIDSIRKRWKAWFEEETPTPELPEEPSTPPEAPEQPQKDFKFVGKVEGNPNKAEVIGGITGLSISNNRISWRGDDRDPSWPERYIGHADVDTVCYLEQDGRATKFEWCRKKQYSVGQHNIHDNYMGWKPTRGKPARLILADIKGKQMVISDAVNW